MRIIRVGIKRVVAQKRYHADELSIKLFRDAEINLVVMDNSIEQYSNQGSIDFSETEKPKQPIDEDGFVSIKEVLLQEGKKENFNKFEQA
jgi:deoxycytidylate deaminase